jgi:CRISPR-associated endoribonuclease Cas6
MRLKVTFEAEKNLILSKEYRRHFISLLKSAFEKVGILDKQLSKKEYKPYTFSVYLGEEFNIDKEIQSGKVISLQFSSGDPVIVTSFYNGILELKKNDCIVFNKANLYIKDIKLMPYLKINSTSAIFKTLGVTVLNDPSSPPDDFKKWYIIPTDNLEKFNECLAQRTNSRYQFLTKKAGIHPIKLSLPDGSFIKETIVQHYGGYVRGFRGIFKLEGTPEILQFVYDYGLGIRTGQGFGMLEIVKKE